MNTTANVDPQEIAKFNELAARWWDTTSEFKALHDINPLRLDYIDQHAGGLAGKTALDVGCGGGILSEGMAQLNATVTGIDMSESPLSVAKLHLYESGLKVDYRLMTIEQLATERPDSFDVITCMEMLEHVPDPASVVHACGQLVKRGGHVFFSTINRTPKSYLFAVIGAEYILGLIPKGTHNYAKLIRPAELAEWLRVAKLEIQDMSGMSYHLLTRQYSLNKDVSVNYLVHAQRL